MRVVIMTTEPRDVSSEHADAARREFLKKCGKFAVVVPPTTVLLLSGTSTKALATGFVGGQKKKR